MPPLAEIEAFVAVVRTGSFVRAAASLNLSTSAVSRAVARLEAALGVRLLQRTTRIVALTDEGRAYHMRCEGLLDAFQEATESVRADRSRLTGRLRVEASGAFGRIVLLPVLRNLLDAHPDLVLQIGLSDRVIDLVEEGVDVAVRIGWLPDSSLVAQTVGDTRLVTVAAPSLLRPADLVRLPRVDFFRPSTGKARPWYFERDGVREELPPTARLSLGSAEALVEAAVQGIGAIQTLDYIVNAQVRAGQLVRLLRRWESPGPPVSVVVPSGRYVSARVREFIALVRDALRDTRGNVASSQAESDR
jgi:LysR family transcriptional regulator, regulator for bpeEF and oprC